MMPGRTKEELRKKQPELKTIITEIIWYIYIYMMKTLKSERRLRPSYDELDETLTDHNKQDYR